MAQILIRNLDAQIVSRLKARARRHGRSLQAEARLILEQAAAYSLPQARQAAEKWRRELGGRSFGDSADLVREDRAR